MALETIELEALCQQQLGGGPWFFFGGAGTRLQKGVSVSKFSWDGQFLEPDCIVRRMAGGAGWDKEKHEWKEQWNSLYVRGPTWEDCAKQLGLR
jgi:hypothetical protein